MTGNGHSLRLYLDEDVEVEVAVLLRTRGHDCLTTRDAGHLGNPDHSQLEFATRENRVLITHNRTDFIELATDWFNQGKEHAGIVLAMRRSDVYELARRLLPVLATF